MTQHVQQVYFRNLDAIRFIAALMVMMSHLLKPIYNSLKIHSGFFYLVLQTICNGELGVSIFFVLSGFLITYLLITEKENTGTIRLKNFYVRRILRIWPLYYLLLLFTFALYPLVKELLGVNQPLASSVGLHLAFLSNFDVIHIQKYFTGSDALSQNITWSVSIEEQFYLFWPLLFVLLPPRLWFYPVILIVFCSLAFRLYNHADKVVLYYHTFSVLIDLGTGGLAALCAKKIGSYRRYFEGINSWHLILFIFLAFIAVLGSNWLYALPFGEAAYRLFISPAFALLITSQALCLKPARWQFQNWKFGSRWGRYTYGIYLIHPVFITLITAAIKAIGWFEETAITYAWIALLTVPFTFLFSYLSFHFYESPFLKMKDTFEIVKTTR